MKTEYRVLMSNTLVELVNSNIKSLFRNVLNWGKIENQGIDQRDII